jgi:hypothetical protein
MRPKPAVLNRRPGAFGGLKPSSGKYTGRALKL